MQRAEQTFFTRTTWTLCGLGAALHAVTAFFMTSEGPSMEGVGWLLWALVPYAAIVVIGAWMRWPNELLGAAIAVLGMDLVTFASIFIWPTSSTAPVALIFIPMWNLFVFGPIGVALAIAISVLAQRMTRGRQ